MTTPEYYTYVYVDPRYPQQEVGDLTLPGQPFYVGKGKNKRAWAHLYESEHRTSNILKYKKIARIKEAGYEPTVMLVYEGLTEEDAHAHEKELISRIGTLWCIEGVKRGTLCNMTGGGEGKTPAEELKHKFRHVGQDNGMWGRTHTAEARRRISEFRQTFKHSEETKTLMKTKRGSQENPHNEDWTIHTPSGETIHTSHLVQTCHELSLTYHSLYTSYKTNKPISRGKCRGYRLEKRTASQL